MEEDDTEEFKREGNARVRRLTDTLKSDLLKLIDRERPVMISASARHEEAQDLAQQMRVYLLSKGVKTPPVEHTPLRDEEMGLGFDEIENRIFVFRAPE